MQNAKDVLANANSNEAQTALDLAIASLVKKDSSNGGDNSNNQNGNTDNNSNTNQDENKNNSSNPSDLSNTNNKTSNQTATNNNTKDTTNLPETGDSPINMLISGLTMLGASLITILVKRRNKA